MLRGDRRGRHSIRVNDQWRICFLWSNGDALDVETGRFPENRRQPSSDWWFYPLPIKSTPTPPAWRPSDGWEVLTADGLDAMRRDIMTEEAERFFDGAEPDWAFALCPKLVPNGKLGTKGSAFPRRR